MGATVCQIGACTLYLGDCAAVLPGLPPVDAIVTDPPYGNGRDKGPGVGGRGFYAVRHINSYADAWDERPDNALLQACIAHASVAIVWGGNYFSSILPENGQWLVWDKQNTMPSFSDCELAWTNIPHTSVKMFRYSNNGLMAKEKDRVHPTQKPVALMQWCLQRLPPGCDRILDPFAGSGTTGVACVLEGKAFLGIEQDPGYFAIACQRIADAYRQPDLFVPSPAPLQMPLYTKGTPSP